MMTSPQGAELACGLCYEEITVQGEIDSCNHRFCHPCIARWSEIENSCPFCKQRFKRLRRKRLAPRAVLLAGGGLGPDSELPGVYEDSQDVEERNQRVVFEDPAFQEWIEELSCMVCGGGENDDLLLLCDGCDRACHTYCAGLAGIPEGEWFCEVCVLSRGNRPQRLRPPVASRAAARPRGRRRQRIDESEEADSDVLEEAEALSSSLDSSSSEEQGAEEAAAGVTARPAPRRRRIASSPPAAAAVVGRRGGQRRQGNGTNVRGVRGQAPSSLDDDLDGFVVPDEDEEWMSSGHRPRNSRRRPVRPSRQEASRGGSAGSGRGREEEEDLDQLPLAARLQRIREREGPLGHRGSSAVNYAPTQAHRDVMALSASWEDLQKGTATFSDLRRPSSNGSGGGMTVAAGQPQRRRLVRAGALAAGGGGSSAGAAATSRPRAADSGASSGGGGVVDLLSSPGFSGPSPSSRHTASPAVSAGEERLAWQAFDAVHQQQQQQQQAGQPRQRQRRRSGSGAGTLPAGGADDLDLDMSLAARIRQQIAEARERGSRLAPRSQPKSQQQPQRQRLLPGSTTGASPHRTARDMQLMVAAARGSTPRSSGQGRGGGGTASARRGFQIPRMQALDGGSNTPVAVGSSPQQQAQYGQQPQQVQQVQQQEGGMPQNPFTRFGLQPGSNSGSTSTALHWRQQGGSGVMGGPLRHEQPQQQPRPYAHQQHSSEQGSGGRHLNRDGGSPRPVYRQPAAPHSLPLHQRTQQHQQGLSPPLWHQQPQQAHPLQLSPLQQQHLPPPPPQQRQFSWPAGLHGSAQWQEGQSRQPLARVAPGVQPTTNGSWALTEGGQSPIAAESPLPPGTVVLQAAAGRAAATPATVAPQQQFQQRPQQPDQQQQPQQQQPQQQQPQKQRQSLSKHDIVNQIKPLLKQCLAEGQLHRDTYKQATVGLLFQLQRPFTAAEAEQAVQQAVQEVLQGQGSPN
ncbi:PHD and RING finger domain-containing protein [Chlorella vulgaris]